ncbi:hypothetical protein CERSUDRAFT_113311 [Gelatoporia subvermispora B]|uniref:Arrestin C-terminal-like domain-containing protein n=1 Tax=Ceriporiopsis subvermispora (strain B) TaxID=914234 RepID=M2PNY2_CERS8|nr:hypothetical protein CERSUDRAFT_113311 [Gelatoporia subvermispora B]
MSLSQAKLTLRPPPNIDFVQGYPGIPPGAPDRPQAAVKGTIEVRAGQPGIKVKWVRIELRKVETLPGGGVANTFIDYVGQTPVNIWQSDEEYTTLHTNDFPFLIRVPESIPPSLALEKGAGIKYELVGTMCVKGKKGFLRRDKPVMHTASSIITIDKHELHSTWPVYSQPETRNLTQDGVTLIVDRSRTCYGPGDRIAVMATVKSDTLHTVILRGFEFTLKETTVFRASPHTPGKKGAPQVKVTQIGEQKVPVNVTLYGGTQHRAELTATIPTHHTTATLNAARHIDITYNLTVKTLMGTGQPLIMDLPVIVSNWPKNVSLEAMRRIGQPPTLCLLPNQTAPSGRAASPPTKQNATVNIQADAARPSIAHPYSMSDRSTEVSAQDSAPASRAAGQYSTAPVRSASVVQSPVDEFGVTQRGEISRGTSIEQRSQDGHPFAQTSSYAAQTIGTTPVGNGMINVVSPRPRSSTNRAAGGGNRLTVANYDDKELAEHPETARILSRNASSSVTPRTPPANAQSKWISAEEEKKRLYERAVANVERVQGIERSRSPTEYSQGHQDAGPAQPSVTTTPPRQANRWPTAEEEKARLFSEAQAAVARTQGLNGSVPDSPPAMSTGAALYSQAMSSINRNASAQGSSPARGPSPPAVVPPSQSAPAPAPTVKSPTPHFPSADQEKAALRRYYEAKAAVDRTQGTTSGVASQAPQAPIAYDALYPSQQPSAVPDSPPAFVPSSSSSQPSYLIEKERLRRAYEVQDRAAQWAAAAASPVPQLGAMVQPTSPPPVPHAAISAPVPTVVPAIAPIPEPYSAPAPAPTSYGFPTPAAYSSPPLPQDSAAAEKELLRRRFEAQDAAALATSGPPAPPPRAGSNPPPSPPAHSGGSRSMPTPPRSPPVPPGYASGSRILTAAEEKARLRAMYEAEEAGTASPPPPSFSSSPPPFSNGTLYANGMPYANGALYTNGANGNALDAMGVPYGLQRADSLTYMPLAPPAPPPLMPRPPREYMQETQEEDSRMRAQLEAIDQHPELVSTLQVDLGPKISFTDVQLSRAGSSSIPPPPPLPTKTPVESFIIE